MDTTITRIVLDLIMSEPDVASGLRRAVETQVCCQTHAASIDAAKECVQQYIEHAMEDSLLPDFAEKILRVALLSHCDWGFVGERVLCSPDHN
jgi:hypothetical protein